MQLRSIYIIPLKLHLSIEKQKNVFNLATIWGVDINDLKLFRIKELKIKKMNEEKHQIVQFYKNR